MSLKSEREQKENYKHQALKQTTKCNQLENGLDEVKEKLKNVQKGLRPQMILQKLKDIERQRDANQEKIKYLELVVARFRVQ